MSRQVLINAVLKSVEGNNKVNLTQAAAGNIVSAVTEAITAGLRESGAFAIHGFGTFRTAARAARVGRNPKTGEKLNIAASKTVTFKAHTALKDSAKDFAVAQPRAVSEGASNVVAKKVVKKKK